MYESVVFVILMTLHCHYFADRYNARGTENDMPRWLGRPGAVISEIECEMLKGSREFTCVFEAEPEEFNRMPDYFPLEKGPEKQAGLAFETRARKQEGCQLLKDFVHSGEKVFHVPYKIQSERDPVMSSFTYLELIYRPDIKKACLRSAYGYG